MPDYDVPAAKCNSGVLDLMVCSVIALQESCFLFGSFVFFCSQTERSEHRQTEGSTDG